jgi:hypothetical protein
MSRTEGVIVRGIDGLAQDLEPILGPLRELLDR